MKKILITGATGNVGIETINSLLSIKSDTEIVAGVRNTAKDAPHFEKRGIKCTAFNFEDSSTFAPALHGIDVLFLLRPPQISDVKKTFHPLIEVAKQEKIQHVVFLSVQGAGSNSVIPHYKIEKLILESGINYTFLRPSYFMQNFTTTLKNDIVKKNLVYLPAGKAKFSIVDLVDVGKVAAKILTQTNQHQNKAYDLTNQELLTFEDMSHQLSMAMGKNISYVSPNLISFFIRKKSEGVKPMFILVMIMLHYLPRFQAAPEISNAVREITGNDPLTFELFAKRERNTFLT
ncbi:MAG: NmrA family NAD(P)-binding protein [Cyclobacteriaceae bacterium]